MKINFELDNELLAKRLAQRKRQLDETRESVLNLLQTNPFDLQGEYTIMRIGEAAKKWQKTTTTIRSWIKAGKISAFRIGKCGKWMIPILKK